MFAGLKWPLHQRRVTPMATGASAKGLGDPVAASSERITSCKLPVAAPNDPFLGSLRLKAGISKVTLFAPSAVQPGRGSAEPRAPFAPSIRYRRAAQKSPAPVSVTFPFK